MNVIKAEFSGRDYRSDVERPLSAENILREAGGRLITFEMQGFIFFGTAIGLLERIRASVGASAKVDYVILGFANVDGLDAAAHFDGPSLPASLFRRCWSRRRGHRISSQCPGYGTERDLMGALCADWEANGATNREKNRAV